MRDATMTVTTVTRSRIVPKWTIARYVYMKKYQGPKKSVPSKIIELGKDFLGNFKDFYGPLQGRILRVLIIRFHSFI